MSIINVKCVSECVGFSSEYFLVNFFYLYPKNSCCTSCSTFLNDMEYIAKMIKLRVHVATMRVGTDFETLLLGLGTQNDL